MARAVIRRAAQRMAGSKRAFIAKALLACVISCAGHQARAAVFSPHTHVLSNGMQVIIVPNRLSPAAIQMVWYKVGAVDDPAGRSGVAHYLEHMMFKGTHSIPDGAFSRIIAANGGEDNAFTTLDYTAYHETIAVERLPLVMQMEADRMRNLLFDDKLAETELSVVRSERQERTDNKPQGLFREKLSSALYGSHPYGRPVIGWRQDLDAITTQDAHAFYHRAYAPNNAILVISGNVDEAEVLRLAAGTFGRLPPAQGGVRVPLPPLPMPSSSRVEMQDKRVTRPSFVKATALENKAMTLRRSDALEVLVEVLSGGEVGLLHRAFVVDKKTASGIAAGYSGLSYGPSYFSVMASPAQGQDLRGLEREVMAYLNALARKGFSAQEVSEAKKRMTDSAIFARDRLIAPAQALGITAAIGRPLSDVEEWPQRIKTISKQEVGAALQAVLADPHTVTGILEPADTEVR